MKILLIVVIFFLISCGNSETKLQQNSIKLGKITFAKNCAVCHGNRAQSAVEDWQEPLANGKYPAPPLNGTAHGWHHSPKSLLNYINNGGAKLGGWMPPFKNKLSEKEKLAILDYLYSLWPKDVQQKYDARFK